MLNHLDIGKEVNNITKPALVQFGTGKIFWQNVLQSPVLLLDTPHGLINDSADFRCVCGSSNYAPPSVFRYEENILRSVLINIFFKAITLVFLDIIPIC